MRTLLAEDDEVMVQVLTDALTQYRYVIDVARDGETAWDLLEMTSYDLVILDVKLPKLDGISLCRRLRAQANPVPILLLTAQDSSTDKVLGLDAGADDYVIKPFDVAELAARLRALARRGNKALPPVLTWAGLDLDPNTREVTHAGRAIALTPKEYGLLELFLRNTRRVFSRSNILDHLWSLEELPDEDTVKAHIKGLRQKLKAAGVPELIETVYGMGYRLKAPATSAQLVSTVSEGTQRHVLASLAAVWERSRPRIVEHVGVLDDASRALLEKTLSDDLRLRAESEAHKLAGSLGTFGLAEGSRAARELEHLLHAHPHLRDRQALHFAELLVALHRELEHASPGANVTQCHFPLRLLALHNRPDVFEPLLGELSRCGFEIKPVMDLQTAREVLARWDPDVVLLDLGFAATPTTGKPAHALLVELATSPQVTTLVVSGDNFEERLEITRLGGQVCLHEPLSADQVLRSVYRLRNRARAVGAKVMVVDDNPELLVLLRILLEPWGLQLATLADPLQFWPTLEIFEPQLLVLDVEMPGLGGIDLCRVVRSDPRWHALPVLFLSAHTDAETIHRAFAGGADDFIPKTIAGPELATRILNRLDRCQSECESIN